MEGAVWNEKFALEDHPEKMVQNEGFNLKITFYSAEMAKQGKFVKALPTDKDGLAGVEKEDEAKKMKSLLNENTIEGDKRILVPIYKYKKRNDKYFICSVYVDCNFPVCEDNTIATSRDVGKLRGVALFASFD